MISLNYSPEELIRHLEVVSDGISVYNARQQLVYANRMLQELVEITPSQLGEDWAALRNSGFFYGSAAPKAFESGKTSSSEYITRAGRHLLSTAVPVLDGDGAVQYVISCTRDITRLNVIRQGIMDERNIVNGSHKKRLSNRQQKDFLYASPQMAGIVELVNKVAKTNLPILLLGETGVGKSDLAEFIHYESLRSDTTFTAINCGAIPPSLCESEFFGYEKGAFTGADKSKPGIFEIANNGTLFLDEIGELPLFMQAKLLRVLQENKVMRIGGTKEIGVNVRIITATNKNISEMLDKKEFREDLFHRLNGIEIEIPPLRERKEDIHLLITYFIHQFNLKYTTSKTISSELFEKLENYGYPGNSRELAYLIERLVVLCPDKTITPRFLPREVAKTPKFSQDEIVPLKTALETTERNLLIRAKQTYRTTRAMGKALGVSHVTIAQKLKHYNIA